MMGGDDMAEAMAWLECLYDETRARDGLASAEEVRRAHVTRQGGGVVFEWWHGQKTLSAFFDQDGVRSLQSSGPGSEQTEGSGEGEAERQRVWDWLTGE